MRISEVKVSPRDQHDQAVTLRGQARCVAPLLRELGVRSLSASAGSRNVWLGPIINVWPSYREGWPGMRMVGAVNPRHNGNTGERL